MTGSEHLLEKFLQCLCTWVSGVVKMLIFVDVQQRYNPPNLYENELYVERWNMSPSNEYNDNSTNTSWMK